MPQSRDCIQASYFCKPLSIQRVRTAAEDHISIEIRRKRVSLRRVVGHLSVLESLEEVHKTEVPLHPPRCLQDMPTTLRMDMVACKALKPSVPSPDLAEKVAWDVDSNTTDYDGSSDEDEREEGEEVIPRVATKSSMATRRGRDKKDVCGNLETNACSQWVKSLWGTTANDENETQVIERIEEVTDVQDQ